MPILATGFASILALWTIGNILFQFRIPKLHRWLSAINVGQFADWSVFSNHDPRSRAGTFELAVCDGTFTAAASWRVVASGYCGSWRGWAWLPRRYSAAAVQDAGRRIRSRMACMPPDWSQVVQDARVLAGFAMRRPGALAHPSFKLRLVRSFPGRGDPDELVLAFSSRIGDAGR